MIDPSFFEVAREWNFGTALYCARNRVDRPDVRNYVETRPGVFVYFEAPDHKSSDTVPSIREMCREELSRRDEWR